MIDKIMMVFSWISGILLLWALASWVDIILHNTTTCIYASWNLFALLF